MSTPATDTLADIIMARRTTKRLADPAARHDSCQALADSERSELDRMLEVAGHAPFHKPADAALHRSDQLASPVPWRFHVLDASSCVALVDWLEQQANGPAAADTATWSRAWVSKIPALLSAASVVVMATWLPNPGSDEEAAFSHANIEHVAAAGAAVQNLLLMAEAAGWDSYWSSGGVLREPDIFDQLGIARQEQLLGAIMLTPRDRLAKKSVAGGLFDQRGESHDWTRHVSL